ncbi:hypothetical protein [Stenotrophomonas phage CM2]
MSMKLVCPGVIARELELVKVRKLVRDAGMDPNGNGKGEVNRLMGPVRRKEHSGPKGPAEAEARRQR